jgi:hypothetical protein
MKVDCVISGFCRSVNEVFALQECNAVLIGIHRHFGTACRYRSSRVKQSKKNSWLPALKRRRLTTSEHCMTLQKIEYLNIDLISSFQNLLFILDLLEFITQCGSLYSSFCTVTSLQPWCPRNRGSFPGNGKIFIASLSYFAIKLSHFHYTVGNTSLSWLISLELFICAVCILTRPWEGWFGVQFMVEARDFFQNVQT